jgi:serine/threonine-protein kinase RsbT
MENTMGGMMPEGVEIVETAVHIAIASDLDIVMARKQARMLGTQLGFSVSELAMIATAVSEVARNIVLYAKNGEMTFQAVEEGGRKGMLISAEDQGPGIADLSLAIQDGYSTGGGLGLGLPGTRRLMDEFQIVSELGKGTKVTLKKWVT